MRHLLIKIARPIFRLVILTPYKILVEFYYDRYRDNPDLAPSIKKMQNQVKELEKLLK